MMYIFDRDEKSVPEEFKKVQVVLSVMEELGITLEDLNDFAPMFYIEE